MSEKYSIEELIVRFLQQDINEDELRYLKSWLEEDVEHKSYFFELKGISDSSRRSFFLEGRLERNKLAENVCPHREIAGEGTFSG
ncbi:MAG: hypothetical protein ACLVK0_11335 [Parabacteroides merdae]